MYCKNYSLLFLKKIYFSYVSEKVYTNTIFSFLFNISSIIYADLNEKMY